MNLFQDLKLIEANRRSYTSLKQFCITEMRQNVRTPRVPGLTCCPGVVREPVQQGVDVEFRHGAGYLCSETIAQIDGPRKPAPAISHRRMEVPNHHFPCCFCYTHILRSFRISLRNAYEYS